MEKFDQTKPHQSLQFTLFTSLFVNLLQFTYF